MNSKRKPGPDDLWFLPLGGCGEIGMNLNLIGHNSEWLMVDCGINITSSPVPNAQPLIEIPNTEFIDQQKNTLQGILVTHAHEDHFGAISSLWTRWRCPIYALAFTLSVIQRKALIRGLAVPENLVEIQIGSTNQYGSFSVIWHPIAHSIPENCGLEITTSAGKIFHSGDWKIDRSPQIGEPFKSKRFAAIGQRGVDAFICDSTNAQEPGNSLSESEVEPTVKRILSHEKGRVIVGCFSSNIARINTIAKIATESGRYVGLLGRSLAVMVDCAKERGYFDPSIKWIDSQHIGYLPRDEVLVFATGSQGEQGAALTKLAVDLHPAMALDAGDAVIFSSSIIPGNEVVIERLFLKFEKLGIHVFHPGNVDSTLHVSGHPCENDLRQMYQLICPNVVIPVHGEEVHLGTNADIALSCGVNKALLGLNGDLFCISPEPRVIKGFANTGRLPLPDRRNNNDT